MNNGDLVDGARHDEDEHLHSFGLFPYTVDIDTHAHLILFRLRPTTHSNALSRFHLPIVSSVSVNHGLVIQSPPETSIDPTPAFASHARSFPRRFSRIHIFFFLIPSS